MTADDLDAAFESVPAVWRAVLPGWTPAAQRGVVDAIRRLSGEHEIGPDDPFRALRLVAPTDVKVVLIGQDPYPTPGQADGLAFSAERIAPRPSLRRIFDVLEADRPGWRRPISGRLDAWAAQGVLLLNSALSVELQHAGSHLTVGWQTLTSEILQASLRSSAMVVVSAWGAHARQFVLQAVPSLAFGSPARLLVARHPSNDYQRQFMRDGSHFAATADRVDWWSSGLDTLR